MVKRSAAAEARIASPSVPVGESRAGVEMAAVRQWQAAEGRLYPLITMDTALYERALTLVRDVVSVLRLRCAAITELIDIDPAGVLSLCPSAPAVSALGLDQSTAFDAARAVRWRELSANQARNDDSSPGDPR
jgi:hypothetical protein